VLSGAPGVGKTRLAREALGVARMDGAATEWVQATQAGASIPLGAFSALMTSEARPRDPLQLFQLCADAVRERASGERVVIGVDDSHLLDPTSAALVLHLATSGTAFVVATVRSGEPCPDSIVALWKDLEAPRVELQCLSADETARLLEAALGGELASSVVDWAYGASGGHILYLRELVRGGLASGALEQRRGRWELLTRPPTSPALTDLIRAGLDGMNAEELGAARLLALGEPLTLDTATALAGFSALAGLEEKGLAVVIAPDASREGTVRLAHPLYGEVVRAATPILRGRELRLRLAETVRVNGLDRPGDALKVARWLEEASCELDEPLLLAAAQEALAAGDPELAETLVCRAPGGVETAVILARSHSARRRHEEAEAILAEWEGRIASADVAISYLRERALRVLHLGMARSADALSLLRRAEDWFADADWSDRIDVISNQVLLTGADPAQASDDLGRLLARDDLIPEVRRRAATAYSLSLYFVGRATEARAASATLRPGLPLRDPSDADALMAWWVARCEAGYDLPAVERWLADAERAGTRVDDPFTRGELSTWIALTAVQRGKAVSATRRAREAIDILERFDVMRRLPLAWLVLVVSTATAGDVEASRAALAGYETVVGEASVAYLRRSEIRARAAVAMLAGETSRAIEMLVDAAAQHRGRPLDRAHLLHEALRAGVEPQAIAADLQEVAAACEAPLAQAFARQATGLARGSGQALVEAADAFAEIGTWLWAAESAALAAVAFDQEGREDSARRALALSTRLRDECEEVWSPILAAVELEPAELTRREREVIGLAAGGHSNAEIARRLVLSVRTVESHLYRAMRKLGVSTRQELGLG
jgi:DNA-binding CsgD family transcriptional regulator